jgi:hypothetical protein
MVSSSQATEQVTVSRPWKEASQWAVHDIRKVGCRDTDLPVLSAKQSVWGTRGLRASSTWTTRRTDSFPGVVETEDEELSTLANETLES